MSFGYGKEWDKHDFKLFEIWKTNLGWSVNAWRFWISYDNYNNTQKSKRTCSFLRERSSMEKYIVSYVIIAALNFICAYIKIRRDCEVYNNPNLEYCFITSIFFPVTWVSKLTYYIKE